MERTVEKAYDVLKIAQGQKVNDRNLYDFERAKNLFEELENKNEQEKGLLALADTLLEIGDTIHYYGLGVGIGPKQPFEMAYEIYERFGKKDKIAIIGDKYRGMGYKSDALMTYRKAADINKILDLAKDPAEEFPVPRQFTQECLESALELTLRELDNKALPRKT